ncbi:MAG TPA: DUF459 domain-containing protein [Beijerinckiaceae bacterium]|jgi:hypothetical protein
MRWRFAAELAFASLLLFATGGPASRAENEDRSRYQVIERFGQPQRYGPPYGQRSSTQADRYQRPSPYAAPGYQAPSSRGGSYYYDPRTRQQYYDPRPAPRQAYPSQPYQPQPAYQPQPSVFPWLSRPQETARPYEPGRPYYEPREARRSYDPPSRKVRRYVPAAPKAADKPEVAEVEPSSYVVVFGDALAELVAQGLDSALEDAEDIGVEKKTRADSGLVRPDVHDWPKAIQEYLNGGQKVTYAVVMLGSNDRQAIREGDNTIDPLSDRWKEIYRQRIDDVVKVFTDRKIPLIWVGTPPVRNERASADFLAINDLYRDRVQKAGGIYVDIWPGFVDDQNRYSPTGPDVEGQVVRLRTADGVYFTRAGARKAAHFADIELKRLIEQRGGGTAVAAPAPDASPAAKELDVDRVISASLPALPEPQGLPSLPVRPVAGPVLPLTRPDTSPGGALTSGRPRLDGDAYLVDRAFREGLAPPPKPGRADDFKWPPS